MNKSIQYYTNCFPSFHVFVPKISVEEINSMQFVTAVSQVRIEISISIVWSTGSLHFFATELKWSQININSNLFECEIDTKLCIMFSFISTGSSYHIGQFEIILKLNFFHCPLKIWYSVRYRFGVNRLFSSKWFHVQKCIDLVQDSPRSNNFRISEENIKTYFAQLNCHSKKPNR